MKIIGMLREARDTVVDRILFRPEVAKAITKHRRQQTSQKH